MKEFMIAVALIGLLSISAYADYECETKYQDKLKKLNSLTQADISDETKSKWISQLEKAYQLCKDGKKEQAAEIMAELRKEKEADTVFSTHDGN
jgi:hypothetical protein